MSTAATQISGEGSRERHARESTSRVCAGGGCSRESIRQAKVIKALAPELLPQITSGALSLNAAYRQVVGEDRRPLYLQLPAWLDDEIRSLVKQSGTSRQGFVLAMLESFFTDSEPDP